MSSKMLIYLNAFKIASISLLHPFICTEFQSKVKDNYFFSLISSCKISSNEKFPSRVFEILIVMSSTLSSNNLITVNIFEICVALTVGMLNVNSNPFTG